MRIGLIVAAVWLAVSCSKDSVSTKPPLRPVRYLKIETTGGVRMRTFSGVSEAGVESRLSFKVPGTVNRRPVRVGDKVTKGQIIAELDKTDYDLQLQQARASAASTSAQSRHGKATYERVAALYENQNASRSDLDAARASYDTARAQVSAASKQVALAKQQLAYCVLRAPVDGAIATVLVDENENVNAGMPIVVMTSGDKLKVNVAIPEVLINEVHKGSTVTVEFEALPGQKLKATISEVGVTSSRSGATFPVMAVLDDASAALRPGMAAEVEFAFGSADDERRFILPPHAVGEDRNGRFVFLLEIKGDGTGVVHRTPVTIGDLSEEGLELLSCVQEGQLVVTAGVSRITDNLQVKVPE